MNFRIKSRIPFPNALGFYFKRMSFRSKLTSSCWILKLFSQKGRSHGSNITKAEVPSYSIYKWIDPAHMVDLCSAGWMLCLTKAFEFFHNSRLIRRIQQNKIYKKFRDLTRNWTQITCLTVRCLNHYTRMFSVLVWGYNWILFHA